MIWNTPNAGDRREGLRFAWLPRQVFDPATGRWVGIWLQSYWIVETYISSWGNYSYWQTTRAELPPKSRT